MKSLAFPASIEPLEARIAPANIFIGGQGAQYTSSDTPFVDTETSGDPIGAVVGGGVPVEKDTFYLRLNKGDAVFRSTETGFVPYLSGPGGGELGSTMIAFFVDKNSNLQFEVEELTGISLGDNASVQVSGTVFGDVVSNYNSATGSLGGSGEAAGSATGLLNNRISLFSASEVQGNILSGGDIKGIRVTNDVGSILAGTAANGVTFDFNGSLPDGGDALVFSVNAGQKGTSISSISLGDATRIQAGNGGAGAVGGSITGVTLIEATSGFIVQAGNGGDGAAGKTKGGAGGKLTSIVVNGLDNAQNDPGNPTPVIEADPTPNSVVELKSGNGGKGFGTSKAGAGGGISDLFFGFELLKGQPTRSATAVLDQVLVDAGDGGSGKSGGKGGGLVNVKVFAAPSGLGNDIEIFAGAGGAADVSGGKAGVGGAISKLNVICNPPATTDAETARVIVDAGDGGSTIAGTKGGKGGALIDADFVAYNLDISSGSGSAGTVGGSAGDIKNVTLTDGSINIVARSLVIDAGSGGAGLSGKGGKGGTLDKFVVVNADFANFQINQAIGAADGGNSKKGAGAVGGLVRNINVGDVPGVDGGNEATMQIRTGNGGNGGDATAAGGKGGAGGSFTNNVIDGFNSALVLQVGSGGSAILKGAGGKAGSVSGFSFITVGEVAGIDASASVTGGAGGAANESAKAGAGGGFTKLNLQAPGAVVVQGGNGGSSTTGSAGGGGGISDLVAFSFLQSVAVNAGDAGAEGGKKGNGGSIKVANLQAESTISVTSGDGRSGGAGGSISTLGFFGSGSALLGSSGAVTIVAGNGSGGGSVAGAGGSVTNSVGFVGSSGITLIQGGNGGAGSNKAASGGGISDLTIYGGGGVGAELQIQGGDAVNVASGKIGGSGGSIKGVAVATLEEGTILRRVVGGDGGNNAGGKGGVGGSISALNVNYDIGVRSGVGFGYDSMGGIFAGAGGTGTSDGGAAGSVTNVTADAIASIVAGKAMSSSVITARNLVTQVSGIILNGSVPTLVDDNGRYTNFETANLVGGVVDPDQPGVPYPAAHPHANTFDLESGEFVDSDLDGKFGLGDTTTAKTDGFIAAIDYVRSKTNFRPEAVFLSQNGTVTFIDLDNTNGQQKDPNA